MANDKTPSAGSRFLWIALGWVLLLLGAIGVILPILPTTPFVIFAAFSFGKGSPRLRAWLLRNRIFGPMILDWEKHGAIAPRYKTMACSLMGVTLGASIYFEISPLIIIIQTICIAAAATYILTRPNK